MKLNFKKIASVLTGAIMLTSTVGFAAAANYPAPFSSQGGAVVYGSAGANTDVVAAYSVEKSIKATTTTTTTSTTGETAALFTGASKINMNDSLQQVKTVITKSDLPTVLAKGSFSGNVDATFEQQIEIGSNPRLIYAKQLSDSNYPNMGFSLSTNTANYIYNATVTFNKAVNFTHADSKNQEIIMFGQKFRIGSATSSTDLVLFKSSTVLNFDSTGTTSAEVTVSGKKYTVELVTASSTSATIAVTDENGNSEQKEVTEGASKKIQGVSIAVNTADSNNQKYTASVVAGAEKITLTSGNSVTVGDSSTPIDGSLVTLTGGVGAATKIVVSVAADSSDKDALLAGTPFTDPVFGSFKLDFSSMNIAEGSDKRENLTISNSGSDKMELKMTNNLGYEKTIQFIKNHTASGMNLQWGDDGKNITVREKAAVHKGEYAMVGNEDRGRLIKVYEITNGSTGYDSDAVRIQDVFSGELTSVTITAEGVGTVSIGGTSYNVVYYADRAESNYDNWNVTFDNAQDTTAAGDIIVFPTMQSSKGAKIAFYEPQTISLTDVDAGVAATTIATKFRFPDGDGFTDVTIAPSGAANSTAWSFTPDGGTATVIHTNASLVANVTIGKLKYAIAGTGTINQTKISLYNPQAPYAILTDPALVIFEEKDDNAAYNALVVTFEDGATSTDYIGVNDVVRTWSEDAQWDAITLPSPDNKKTSETDLFGTIALIDQAASDQYIATISYPDEQVYADVYFAKTDATITPGEESSTGVLVAVSDKESALFQDKNLIVVGGSCVNKAAAKIIADSENPICGADFTDKTQVSATQYIIKSVKSPYNAEKIAVLVAGYEAVDTQSAVTTLLEGATTDVGTSQVYPINSGQ